MSDSPTPKPTTQPALDQWLREVQRIIRERYADIYGSKYVADEESWECFHADGLSPELAVEEDRTNI